MVAPITPFREEDVIPRGHPRTAIGGNLGKQFVSPAKPSGIDKIVLGIDDPRRRENLRALDGTAPLDRCALGGAGANDATISPGNVRYANLVPRMVPQRGVILRPPQQIAPCCAILEKNGKHAGHDLLQVVLQNVRLSQQGHKSGAPPFAWFSRRPTTALQETIQTRARRGNNPDAHPQVHPFLPEGGSFRLTNVCDERTDVPPRQGSPWLGYVSVRYPQLCATCQARETGARSLCGGGQERSC